MRKIFLTLILLLSIPVVFSTSISTDKNDYYPKQSILISGQGFQPNIDVIIQINDPEGVVKFVDQIRTDDNGEFSTAYVTKSDDNLGLYSVYANGGDEQVQESFTVSKEPSITTTTQSSEGGGGGGGSSRTTTTTLINETTTTIEGQTTTTIQLETTTTTPVTTTTISGDIPQKLDRRRLIIGSLIVIVTLIIILVLIKSKKNTTNKYLKFLEIL
ncbi:MAG: hypothetical protein ISS48_02705 [Candidatus Aenigmarchaeota archaeon]|nr:hypothetical protein [Candidatus Aenigmarchaeota archaeon]